MNGSLMPSQKPLKSTDTSAQPLVLILFVSRLITAIRRGTYAGFLQMELLRLLSFFLNETVQIAQQAGDADQSHSAGSTTVFDDSTTDGRIVAVRFARKHELIKARSRKAGNRAAAARLRESNEGGIGDDRVIEQMTGSHWWMDSSEHDSPQSHAMKIDTPAAGLPKALISLASDCADAYGRSMAPTEFLN